MIMDGGMNVREMIREEIRKIMELNVGSSQYSYPDFLDPQYNPLMKKYPPVGFTNYGTVMKEDNLEEDYPASFDMEYFKTLNSFNARIKYCEEHLQRLSSGSSRIVYKIDDQKVLKLAKNKAGLAQNELEYDSSGEHMLDEIIAKVFDVDENFLWIEMEFARKMSMGEFKKISGYNFKDFSKALHNYGIDAVTFTGSKFAISPELVESMWEDEFVYEIFQYIGNYAIPPGDLMKISSYGIVNRGGGDEIVLIDYGFSSEIHSNYYS